MTEEYVEEDNIKVLLSEYINWLDITAIYNYFDEDLKGNITIFINSSTLKNYLSNFIIILKDKFPNHCAWEKPECKTSISGEDFDKKCKCEQGRGGVDVYEYTKYGMYS